MSKLSLPNITLVMMDTTCPELAKLAVEDSLGVADFGDVVVFSDKTWMDGPRFIKAQPWRSPDEYNHYFWYEVPKYLTTEWAIFIQWDSWLLDASQWADEFLQYDYIGAPWWYFDHLNVGNGCGLRSTRLMRFLAVEGITGQEEAIGHCRLVTAVGNLGQGRRYPARQAPRLQR